MQLATLQGWFYRTSHKHYNGREGSELLWQIAGWEGGFPKWHVGKEPACQGRRCKRCGFGAWSGRCPGEGSGNPLQYSCLENPMDREAWGTTIHGCHERVIHDWVTKQQLVGKIFMYSGSWSQGKWFSVDMCFRHCSVAWYFYLQVFGHMCSMGFTSGLKLALHLFIEGNNYLRRWGFLDIIYVIEKSDVAVWITSKPREQIILLMAHNPTLHNLHASIFRSSKYPAQIVLYF